LNADTTDYDTFVAPIRHRIVNSVWRIVRNAEDTEDVVQDALLQILKKIKRIRAHPNPTAMILRICVNLAIDRQRRQTKRRDASQNAILDQLVDERAMPPDEALAQTEQQTRVLAALRDLPKREAEAIVLHVLEQLPYAAVADGMKCRESTVRVLVSKARRRLRKQFGLSDTPEAKDVSTP
jgi:RNA polymerase sigma-70 factor, ECF subfamily